MKTAMEVEYIVGIAQKGSTLNESCLDAATQALETGHKVRFEFNGLWYQADPKFIVESVMKNLVAK